MDFLQWKELGFAAAAAALAWYIYQRDKERDRAAQKKDEAAAKKDEATLKILSDQVSDARKESARNVDAFLERLQERDELLRDTMEHFGHLRMLGSEHSGALSRIEQHARDRDRHKQ